MTLVIYGALIHQKLNLYKPTPTVSSMRCSIYNSSNGSFPAFLRVKYHPFLQPVGRRPASLSVYSIGHCISRGVSVLKPRRLRESLTFTYDTRPQSLPSSDVRIVPSRVRHCQLRHQSIEQSSASICRLINSYHSRWPIATLPVTYIHYITLALQTLLDCVPEARTTESFLDLEMALVPWGVDDPWQPQISGRFRFKVRPGPEIHGQHSSASSMMGNVFRVRFLLGIVPRAPANCFTC
ncbi:hypothetical protein BDW66DRAFT_143086 [Aspergillus desertorum]